MPVVDGSIEGIGRSGGLVENAEIKSVGDAASTDFYMPTASDIFEGDALCVFLAMIVANAAFTVSSAPGCGLRRALGPRHACW